MPRAFAPSCSTRWARISPSVRSVDACPDARAPLRGVDIRRRALGPRGRADPRAQASLGRCLPPGRPGKFVRVIRDPTRGSCTNPRLTSPLCSLRGSVSAAPAGGPCPRRRNTGFQLHQLPPTQPTGPSRMVHMDAWGFSLKRNAAPLKDISTHFLMEI